jgi:plastocyanin
MVGAFAAVLPALAANGFVEAGGASWDPARVAVKPGEKVTFTNPSSLRHTLKFDDEASSRADGAGWVAERTFNQTGTYRFICEVHYSVGMVGRVFVNETGTLPTDPTPSPTPGASATPSASATATATPTPPSGGGGSTTTPAELLSADVSVKNRRVRLEIDLSAPAEVTGKVKRKRPSGTYKRFGSVDFGIVDAGPQKLSFKRVESGKRLKKGRYKLKLSAGEDTETLKFRVRG